MINPLNVHAMIDARRVNKKLLNISISFTFFLFTQNRVVLALDKGFQELRQ